MLGNASFQATIPVIDLQRAREFYRDVLELEEVGFRDPWMAEYMCGDGTSFTLYVRKPSTADHTLGSFEVMDIEVKVAEMKAHGIVFEDYDTPELRTVNHIATWDHEKSAWFRDSEGNILALHQDVEASI